MPFFCFDSTTYKFTSDSIDVNYIIKHVFKGISKNLKVEKIIISKTDKKGVSKIDVLYSGSNKEKVTVPIVIKKLNEYVFNSNKGDKYEGIPMRFENARFLKP